MNPTSCSQTLRVGGLWQAVPSGRAQHSAAMCIFLTHFDETHQTCWWK